MRRPTVVRRLAFSLLVCLGLPGCDALLTEPAPGDRSVTVSLAVVASGAVGTASAFAKVDRAHLIFIRPDSARRDTVIPVRPQDGLIRARLALDAGERVAALGVVAQLRRGSLPLFHGQRVIRVEIGTPTSAEIELAPVPAALRAGPSPLQLEQLGDTVRMSTLTLFATGDTIGEVQAQWASANPQVVLVTSAGLAVARAVGQTALVARLGALADTVPARVLGGR